MKVKSLGAIANTSLVTERKKIAHVDIFPDDYNRVSSFESVSVFYDMVRSTVKRYEENTEIIARIDREIQDLLHEAELLPAVNVVQGYRFYEKIRSLRRTRRIAKSENTTIQPVYTYLSQHPDFVREMQGLRDACMSADTRIANFEYEYRIQE